MGEKKCDWTLTEDQVRWFVRRKSEIETAYECDDKLPVLDELEQSAEYKATFGDMVWDEAYDRFECWLDGETSAGDD